MKELEFHGNDPGAVRHGNFINYYQFHNTSERIDNLSSEMFPTAPNSDYVCLDVGCNSGELTIQLYKYLNKLYPNCSIHILGIDIDQTLIQRAADSSEISNITYTCLNITKNDAAEHLQKYLKEFKKTKFDVTFSFSITMWIHLNNGDEGLLSFLQLIKDVSERVVIEPQPWHCYRNAQRRLKKSGSNFPFYTTIKIRSEVVDKIVDFMKQQDYTQITKSISSSWKRNIYCFQRIKSDV